MPCFSVGVAQVTNTLRQRFQLHLSADDAEQFVETDLIAKSFGSYYTRLYVVTLRFLRHYPLLTSILVMIPFNIEHRAYTRDLFFSFRSFFIKRRRRSTLQH